MTNVSGNGQSATYTYDGDGNRVKKVDTTGTTIYVGALYEKNVSTAVETSYYFAGSTRIAMRKGGVLSYFAADHLGSTSLTMDASGNKTGELKYKPFGETRYTWGSTPTDRKFTGQRQEDSSLGSLYDYGARMYSPVLGRFLSADTMVPGAGNPQQFNRYAYVSNNPIKNTDPTGHKECYGYAPSNQYDMGNGVGDNSCAGGDWDAVRAEENLGKMQDQVRAECAAADGACGPETAGGRLVRGLEFAVTATYCAATPLSCAAGAAIGYGGYRVGNSVGNFIAGERDPKTIFEKGVNARDAEFAMETGALGFGRGIVGSGLLSGVQYSAGQIMKGESVKMIDLIATSGLGSASAWVAGGTSKAVTPFVPQLFRGVTENAVIPIVVDNALTIARSAIQQTLTHMVLDPIFFASLLVQGR